jgi:hypothetical protein
MPADMPSSVGVPGVASVCVPGVASVCVPGVASVCVPGVASVCVPGVASIGVPGVASARYRTVAVWGEVWSKMQAVRGRAARNMHQPSAERYRTRSASTNLSRWSHQREELGLYTVHTGNVNVCWYVRVYTLYILFTSTFVVLSMCIHSTYC